MDVQLWQAIPMQNWTFDSLEGGKEPARPLFSARQRGPEECGCGGFVGACALFWTIVVAVTVWWFFAPWRVAAMVVAASSPPPVAITTGAGDGSGIDACNCPDGQGWCSFAHCTPCCHPGCTTSANERAQCSASA